MRLLCGFDREVGQWVADRIPHVGDVDDFGPFVSIGVVNDANELVAGVVYHNYLARYDHIEASFAASTPKFCTRGVVLGILSYPFEQQGCRRVSLMIPSDANRTKKFSAGIGFVREGCVREFFGPKQHGEIYGMTTKDYRKLRERMAYDG